MNSRPNGCTDASTRLCSCLTSIAWWWPITETPYTDAKVCRDQHALSGIEILSRLLGVLLGKIVSGHVITLPSEGVGMFVTPLDPALSYAF